MIKPFKNNIPDKALQEIYTKVKNYPWHEMPEMVAGNMEVILLYEGDLKLLG